MRSIVLCDNAEPEKVLPLCEKYGLGIEIQGFYDTNTGDNTANLISQYQSLLPKGMEKHLHAPFWELCMGSKNRKIVEVTQYYFDYAYKVAEELGCESMTVHQGYIPHTSYPSGWISRSAAFWDTFLEGHPGQLRIYMENQLEQNPETLNGILDIFPNERLGVNLDVGHANCSGGLSVIQWIEELKDRIQYVHLHQNNGLEDEHLGLDQGNMPIRKVLEMLEEYSPNSVWALECGLDSMERSIDFLGNYGYIL